MSPAYASPTALTSALVARFLDAFVRPCEHALELRADQGLRCSTCDRLFVPRVGKADGP